MDLVAIPAFEDNYIWCIRAPNGRNAVVVDPGDEEPVIEYFEREGLRLTGILITHHHGDHTGGVADLLERWPGIPVFGPADKRIHHVTRPVKEGDTLGLDEVGLSLRVMSVPGHTSSHVAYVGEGVLFCGDTLFAGGCGRVFDGTHEQLADSLLRIAALPVDTEVYCAHEYTQANMGFARWVEPDSEAVAARVREVDAVRAAGRPTVPSSLAIELATNPFLRVNEPVVKRAAERYAGHALSSPAEVFTALRNWKDKEYD